MKNNSKRRLDFSRLPDTSYTHSAWRVSDETRSSLASLPETLARYEGAIMFSLEAHRLPPETDLSNREAYLRAALADYVSMGDALRWDTGGTAPCIISQSSNPLIHFVTLLRHLNVHFQKTSLTAEAVSAVWLSAGAAESDHHFEMTIWTIPDLTVGRLSTLRDSRRYEPAHLEQMCDWFNSSQSHWGASDLVRRAAEAFASEILASEILKT